MNTSEDTPAADSEEVLTPRPASSAQIERFQLALQVLDGKWKVDILWQLSHGVMRFGELRRCVPGITHHMLAMRLRELEAIGLVKRTEYDETPARVEYELTTVAVALRHTFHALLAWAEKYEKLILNPNCKVRQDR